MVEHDINRFKSVLKRILKLGEVTNKTYNDLLRLVEAEEVKDWDGKEPLRRNHRVKWPNSSTPRIVVAVNDKHKQIVTVTEDDSDGEFRFCGIGYIKPFRTEADKLFEEWYNTLGSDDKIVSFSEKQLIDLINLVLRKKDVL